MTGFLSKLRSGRWATVRVDHMVAYEAGDTCTKLNASRHSSCESQETESESHLDSMGGKKKKNPMTPSVMPPPVIVHLLAETWKDSQMNYSLRTSTHAVGGEWKEEEEEKRRRVVERVSRFTQSAWRGHRAAAAPAPTLHSDRLAGLSAALHAHHKNIFTKYFSQCGVLVYRMDCF